MKKLLLAVCLMFGGATLVSAQNDPATTPSPGQTQTTQDQDQGQQISVSELPDAVTAKLEGQDYTGWTVGNAYKKMDDANQEMYIVELKQGTETKKVKFDRDGNEIEKGKHDKDNSNYRDPSDASQTDQSSDQSATDQATQPDQSTDQADNSSTDTEQQ
jgi:hypothetical protein